MALRFLLPRGISLILLSVLLAWAWLNRSLPAEILVIDEPPVKSDAIVVLLGQSGNERVDKAAELYRNGYSERIVFAAGFYDHAYGDDRNAPMRFIPAGAEYQEQLKRRKVPVSAIEMPQGPEVYDTATEISHIAKQLRAAGRKSVLLVTSFYHSRRARFIWSRLAPDLQATSISALEPGWREWWRSPRLTRALLNEYGGFAKEYGRRAVHAVRGGDD